MGAKAFRQITNRYLCGRILLSISAELGALPARCYLPDYHGGGEMSIKMDRWAVETPREIGNSIGREIWLYTMLARASEVDVEDARRGAMEE